ncbi:MAG: hypothetical protein KME43_26040 [Myxacorys chilensis ATA2-1-KO14]|jgi:hypothetical protein|nr:hypothetical protein [Myxacorys chilensis ATA2-1-KO14]
MAAKPWLNKQLQTRVAQALWETDGWQYSELLLDIHALAQKLKELPMNS